MLSVRLWTELSAPQQTLSRKHTLQSLFRDFILTKIEPGCGAAYLSQGNDKRSARSVFMSPKMAEKNYKELATEDASNADPRANGELTILDVSTSLPPLTFRTNLAASLREQQNGFHSKVAMPTFIEIV